MNSSLIPPIKSLYQFQLNLTESSAPFRERNKDRFATIASTDVRMRLSFLIHSVLLSRVGWAIDQAQASECDMDLKP